MLNNQHIINRVTTDTLYKLDEHSVCMRLTHAPQDYTGLPTNCYVYMSHSEALVIDPGLIDAQFIDELHDLLQRYHISPHQVNFLATHVHDDHAGCINELRDDIARVYVHEASKSFLHQCIDHSYEQALFNQLVSQGCTHAQARTLTTQHMSYIAPLELDSISWLKNNDVICVGDFSLRVMGTPGHTPGCMSLFDEAHGVVITGDVLLKKSTPLTYMPSHLPVLKQYGESLELITSLGSVSAFPAHGDVISDAAAACAREHIYRQNRMDAIRETLSQATCPLTAVELLMRMRTRSIHATRSLSQDIPLGSMLNMMAYLDYMSQTGLILRKCDHGFTCYTIA